MGRSGRLNAARNQIPESLSDERLDNQPPIWCRVAILAAENDVARNIAASGSMDARLMEAIELALGVVDPRIFYDVVFEIGQQHGSCQPLGLSGIILTGIRDDGVLQSETSGEGGGEHHVLVLRKAGHGGLEFLQLAQREAEVGSRIVPAGEVENEGLARRVERIEVSIEFFDDPTTGFPRGERVERQRIEAPVFVARWGAAVRERIQGCRFEGPNALVETVIRIDRAAREKLRGRHPIDTGADEPSQRQRRVGQQDPTPRPSPINERPVEHVGLDDQRVRGGAITHAHGRVQRAGRRQRRGGQLGQIMRDRRLQEVGGGHVDARTGPQQEFRRRAPGALIEFGGDRVASGKEIEATVRVIQSLHAGWAEACFPLCEPLFERIVPCARHLWLGIEQNDEASHGCYADKSRSELNNLIKRCGALDP